MRKSSLAMFAALVTATGVALAYGSRDTSTPTPSTTTSQMLPASEDSEGPAQQLPPNHPAIQQNQNAFHGMTPGADEEKEPAALAWKAPATWSAAPNPNQMRLATYKLPRGSEKDDAELAVSRAGGEVNANVSRWVGQFEGAGAPKQTKRTVHDLQVTEVQVEGTYQGGMGAQSGAHEHWALLGAIVETKGQSYFFKVIGPAATVRAAKAPFDAMIDSVTPN